MNMELIVCLLRYRQELKEDHPSALHFSAKQLPSETDKSSITYPLYPYTSDKLAIIFVYGTDYQREMNILFIPGSVQILATLILLFVFLATIILCIVRRGGFMSAFIDIVIAFIAGGNLRMRFKFERWFFGILLISAFFITSIFTGNLLDCVYQVLNQEINTFEQLANINLPNIPAYINPTLAMHSEDIRERLRLVHQSLMRCTF